MNFVEFEEENVKFAEINCVDTDMDSAETCIDEAIEEFPTVHIYKEGIAEDFYSGDRCEAICSFNIHCHIHPKCIFNFVILQELKGFDQFCLGNS